MSTLLEQASLIMIPSGYKEDVVYSVIPENGNGDLSFTRASNGTRINSAGLVEVCPWNLLEYSEDLSNSVWGNDAGNTKISNTTTAPNGTVTADTISAISGNVMNVYQIITTNDGTLSYSVYLKKNATNLISIYIYQTFGSSAFKALGEINFDNGTFTPSIGTGTIESVGNGWFRVSVTANLLSGANSFGIYTTSDTGTRNVYLWGAQLNIGSTAKPYFPTTDRLNVPRLTYQNGGGGCPSLLLEKQSTNLIKWSEQFDNAAWTKENLSVSANNGISPDGTQNADKLIADTDNTDHSIYQSDAIFSGASLSFTTYAKANGYNYIFLGANNNVASDGVFFNLTNGTISQNTSGLGASIQSVGNGWYRCVVTASSFPSVYAIICLSENGTSLGFAGDNSKGVLVWGAQIEASSYPTSYIPTTSASATRVADACFKTGISSLIGQTEGVLFVDAKNLYPSGARTIGLLFTSVSAFYQMYINSSNQVRVDVNGSFLFLGGTIAENTQYKIAFAYKSGSNALYINGTQIATSASTTIPSSLTDFYVGNSLSSEQSGSINQAILFPTRLTNAELASLTTL